MLNEVFTCGNCGKQVSKNALKCPHCGVQFGGVRDRNSFEIRSKSVTCKKCGYTSSWYASREKGQCRGCCSWIDMNGNPTKRPEEDFTEGIARIIALIFSLLFIIGINAFVNYVLVVQFLTSNMVANICTLIINVALFCFLIFAYRGTKKDILFWLPIILLIWFMYNNLTIIL